MKLKRKGGPAKRETGCSKFSLFLVFEIEILRLCSILLIRRGGEVPSRRARSDAYHRSAEKHRNIFSFPFSFFPPSLPMQHYALHQSLLPFLSKILLHDQTDISPVIKYNLKFLSKKKKLHEERSCKMVPRIPSRNLNLTSPNHDRKSQDSRK